MKKTYMIPTLQVVKIQPAQFIANSMLVDPGISVDTQMGREATFSDFGEADFDTSLPNTFQFDME
jgi:hypothetical protein